MSVKKLYNGSGGGSSIMIMGMTIQIHFGHLFPSHAVERMMEYINGQEGPSVVSLLGVVEKGKSRFPVDVCFRTQSKFQCTTEDPHSTLFL